MRARKPLHNNARTKVFLSPRVTGCGESHGPLSMEYHVLLRPPLSRMMEKFNPRVKVHATSLIGELQSGKQRLLRAKPH